MMGKLGQMMGIGGGMPTPSPKQSRRCRSRSAAAPGARLALGTAGHSRRAAARRLQRCPPQFPGLGAGAKLPGLGGGFNPFGGKKK